MSTLTGLLVLQLCTLSFLDKDGPITKDSPRTMLWFFGFPEVKTGPRAKPQHLPMSVWTNGNFDPDSDEFRTLMLGVGELTACWDEKRSFKFVDEPSAKERKWRRRPDMQSKNRESQIINKVTVASDFRQTSCCSAQERQLSMLCCSSHSQRWRGCLRLKQLNHEISGRAQGAVCLSSSSAH